MISGKLLRIAAVVVYAGTTALACSLAKDQDLPPLPTDPTELVRNAVAHELNAMDNDHTRWMYRLHKEDEKNTQDREVIVVHGIQFVGHGVANEFGWVRRQGRQVLVLGQRAGERGRSRIHDHCRYPQEFSRYHKSARLIRG